MLWDGWFTRFRRRNHEPTTLATLEEIEHFKALVKDQKCLGCNQLTLQLERYVRNPHGWDAEISCTNCKCHGVVNSEGFSFERIHSKGKARKE